MDLLASKKEVALFVCGKSVDEKKPFFVDKSVPNCYIVKCPEEGCAFKMLFRGNSGGFFQLVEQQEHDFKHFNRPSREPGSVRRSES